MKKISLILGAMALIGCLASCSQAEMDEPAGKTIEKGTQVSVTLTAPDDFMQSRTRATGVPENLKMRYIVEIWNADATILLQRKESVEGDADANKFTFDLTTGTYQLLCWADKIDATATTNKVTIGSVEFDHYTDLFFKTAVTDTWTQNGLKCVHFIPNTNIDNAIFNNPELDNVFCGKQEVQKTENIIDNLNITLKRPLCKIIFKQKDPTAANTTDICKAIQEHGEGSQEVWVCRNPYYNVFTQDIAREGSIQIGASPMTIFPGIPLLPNAATDGELLFCHTFAGLELSNLTHSQDFDVRLGFVKADGAEKELQRLEIPKGTIQVQANHRVILTGNILKQETKGEAANFTLTTDENWSGNGDHNQDLDTPNS